MTDSRITLRLSKEALVDASLVRSLFDYSIVTGNLYYREDGKGSGGYKRKKGAIAGGKLGGYIAVRVGYNTYLAHRVIWLWITGTWPEDQVDHIDRCRFNNAWHNLRVATNRQNHQNRSDNTSGTAGVVWEKSRSKWKAYCRIGYVMHNLGRFDTQAEAVQYRKDYLQTYGIEHEVENPE